MAKKKNNRLTTPKGEMLFPYLDKPDTRHDDDGTYHVNLIFEEDDKFLADIEKLAKKQFDVFVAKLDDELASVAMYVSPIKEVKDADKKVVKGKKMLYFKTKAFFKDKKTGEKVSLKPKLFDGSGNFIKKSLPIGNGTIAQVNFAWRSTKMSGEDRRTKEKYCDVFMSFYLNAVAIHELVTYGASAEGFGFDTSGGGFNVAESGFDMDDAEGGADEPDVDEEF